MRLLILVLMFIVLIPSPIGDYELISIREFSFPAQVMEEPLVEKKIAEKKREPEVSRGVSRTMIATAYTASEKECGKADGITATGTKVKEGRTVAVDPKVIPLGSTLKITCPSYPSVNGKYIAEDVGGAIKGNKIDIYLSDYDQCIKFGKRKVEVIILN